MLEGETTIRAFFVKVYGVEARIKVRTEKSP
jgi:hypothetical protein